MTALSLRHFRLPTAYFSVQELGGLEQPRHLDYLHRRHHSASKISQIYELDLERGKLTRRERLPSRTKSEWLSVERCAYSFALADSWTIARREEGARGIIETEITVETTQLNLDA